MELQSGVNWRDEVWGEIKSMEEVCPGVFYLTTNRPGHIICREMYAVMPDSIISEEALAYGESADGGLHIFEYEVDGSGWELVHYELLRYQAKHGIPIDETDSLYCSAIYAADRYPAYFGGLIPPRITPWGLTLRYKKAAEGIFFLETDHCEWVLALSYPIWSVELSDVAKHLGKQCSLDKQMGEEEAEYLYFKRDACAPPIYELLDSSEYKGLFKFIRSKEVLETHLSRWFPEYVIWHNSMELSGHGISDILENLLGAFGCRPEVSDEQAEEKQAQRISNCIRYMPELEELEHLLLPL